MSAKSQPVTPPDTLGRSYSEEDNRAQFASVIWLEDQIAGGKMTAYQKKFVAVLGDQVIDADADADELTRRLDSLGGTIPQYRVVVRYIPGPGDNY